MAVDIDIQHIFGARCEFRNSVAFLDSNQIIYPAGSYLVKHRLDTNQQTFLYLQSQSTTITALAVYRGSLASLLRKKPQLPGRKRKKSTTTLTASNDGDDTAAPRARRNAPRLVAYSEFNANSPPAIFLYDANTGRKRRVFTHTEMESNYWKHLEFSFDGVYLLAVSGSPDHTIVCWNWVKNRLVGSWRVGLSITKASFLPRDHNTMVLIGQGIFKLFQWAEGQARVVLTNTKLEHTYIMSQAFTEGASGHHRMFLGTSSGKLLVWEDNEIIADLRSPHHEVDLSSSTRRTENPVCYVHPQ